MLARARWLARWLVAALVAGVLAGASGALLTLLLDAVQRVLLGHHGGPFGEGFHDVAYWRRVLAPTLGGAVAGLGWWLVRRHHRVVGLDRMHEWFAPRELARVLADAVLQVLVVGSGASVGREGAPRQGAAALTSVATRRLVTSSPQRRRLVAAAAGAGLAAVYSTPLAGALFALEVVGRRRDSRPGSRWGLAGAGLLSVTVCALAVVAAWPVTRDAATYPWTGGRAAVGDLWLVLLVAPLAWLVGEAFGWLARRARQHAVAPGPRLVVSLAGAGLVLGLLSCWLPVLPGNGKAIVQFMLTGDVALTAALALVVVKALVTALFLRAGAIGGLLTPALAVGAALGTAVGGLLGRAELPVPVAVWAITGAAVVLAVSERAPWFAAVFAWELARPPLAVLPVLLAACLLARGLSALVERRVARRGAGPAAGRASWGWRGGRDQWSNGHTRRKEPAVAELSSKKRDDLPDRDFAWVDDKGDGHLPIHDESHVRNAISRFNQTRFASDDDKRSAARKVLAAAKQHGIDVADDDAVAKAAQ